ncbi:hypothetical protein MPTK1_2g05600 [Marchantia polymorpha subsp. ruderalis]|uniref:Uncharacterized protein n=2 Tax=Marchantia polymorpha TaxID=3197 RepID=A0A176WKF4_MARPO|nr:hypothetical protein AXG93_786s1100 [Marchantia polymorpha subsp. ruderalis]PTQ44134.1 hypothetical protein MARPO_0021s0016 [Marchantia polymorpha]BBN01210.1 hypothetical protein Mp_2g05600 [Marchantia polymorpha subsp. ruderalis]|eukprot:PTQ44134.1 hypothetical protein MARPO_0021s0016 [Marchantia polymorpha]
MAGCVSAGSLVCASSAAIALPSRCAVKVQCGQQRVSFKSSFVHSLRHQHQRTSSHVARQAAVAELSDFAVQESAKFREGLLQQLEANPITASEKAKIADVCTKIFGDYMDQYEGSLSPSPFGEMKEALESENLPGSNVAVCAALGWSRGHLHRDWKMSKEKK